MHDRVTQALHAFHAAIKERQRLDAVKADERADRGISLKTQYAWDQAVARDDETGQALRAVLLETEVEA